MFNDATGTCRPSGVMSCCIATVEISPCWVLDVLDGNSALHAVSSARPASLGPCNS